MKLIDRDLLLAEIAKSREKNPHEDSKIRANHTIEHDHIAHLVLEQPTAYDVDKVLERLKQIKTDNSCKNCTYREKCDELQEFYNPSDEVDLCALVTKELSIQIVKSGGIE